MVRPDYCAVDHLQTGVAAAAVVEGFEQQLPQAGQRPAPELTVNRRPFAEMLMQVAPCDTSPRNPENPIQNKAMISRTTPAARAAFDHERLKTRPFVVAHQTPDQHGLPKRHLESDTHPFGNPICQHALIDLKDRQHLFRSVVLPSLSGLDFGTEGATRWWLVPERKTLVADPERSFGQPIIAEIGLLTSRVAQELKAEGSADRVARLYEIPVRAVRDALKFESDRSFKQAA